MTARGYSNGAFGGYGMYGGGGYGSGLDPRVTPGYYGPTGATMVDAFQRNFEDNRQAENDQATRAHQQLEDALTRATAYRNGLRGNGIGDDEPSAGAPAAPGAGGRLPPAQPATPGAPRAGADPTMGGADVSGQPPSAFTMPGAFNPSTGAHNPADINLGGGYRMAGTATPEFQRQRQIEDLQNANIPGMTPEMAMFLADHPDQLGSFMDRAYAGPAKPQKYEPQSFDESVRLYQAEHPNTTADKPEMTMDQALAQVDEMYGQRDPVSGQVSSRLSPQARMRVAEEITHGDFHELQGATGGFGGGGGPGGRPTYEDATKRLGLKLSPRTADEQTQDEAGQPGGPNAERQQQLDSVRTLIPKNADPTRVRQTLKKHGLTDDEITYVLRK